MIGPAPRGDRPGRGEAPQSGSDDPSLEARFTDPALLRRALTHASAAGGPAKSVESERLEFLGDRVLGLVVADALMARFPDESPGLLARRLNALVDGATCARMACAIALDRRVVAVGIAHGQRGFRSVLADTMEAVIGALYVDGGLAAARRLIVDLWDLEGDQEGQPPLPPKSALQEWVQARGHPTPGYALVARKGPDHAPRFTVRAVVGDREGPAATGGSLQEAESAAAEALLALLVRGS